MRVQEQTAATGAQGVLQQSGLGFALQPVVSVDDTRQVLYRECLARMQVCGGSREVMPGHFMPDLQRMGLTRHFDRCVVTHMIDRLREDDTLNLGCNISVQSAVDDLWWCSVTASLQAEPAIAGRLVLEVSERTPVNPNQGRRFVSHMRRLGCRVAIDDFGVRYGRDLISAVGQADIIKLGGSLLECARGSAVGTRQLTEMIALAADQAACVVVKGVESHEDLELAVGAGATWVQGYYLGGPESVEMARALYAAGWSSDGNETGDFDYGDS